MSPSQVRSMLHLTPQQNEIVDCWVGDKGDNRITVVSAGAGTGKTQTTVAAVLELIERRRATLDQFALITFTNKAADELRSRMQRELSHLSINARTTESKQLWYEQLERLSSTYIGTIHGFCSLIIRTFGYEERASRDAERIQSSTLLQDAIREITEEYIADTGNLLLNPPFTWREHELREIIRDILLKDVLNAGLDPAYIADQTNRQPDDEGKMYRVELAQLAARANLVYSVKKREKQVLDSYDLLKLAGDILAKPEGFEIANKLSTRYQYLMIDEFQDTDPQQKRLVDALKSWFFVLVVGDRKQSIYRFRAAEESLLSELAAENNVPLLPLTISRRPSTTLLAIQNALFSSIGSRYPFLNSLLESSTDSLPGASGCPPMVYVSTGRTSRYDEAVRATAEAVRYALSLKIVDADTRLRSVQAKDVVILSRSNNQVQRYERELPKHLVDLNVLVRSDRGEGLFAQPEIVSVYHMLRLLLQYPDDTALALAVTTPYLRNVDGGAKILDILQYRPQDGVPLTDWFEENYPDYANLLKELRAAVRSETVPQLLSRLYNSFQIMGYYSSVGNRKAIGNLEKLRDMARGLFKNEQALTLISFVSWLERAVNSHQLESEAVVPEDSNEDPMPVIPLMTIHRAKGLEYPIVIIPDVNRPVVDDHFAPEHLVSSEWGLDVHLPAVGLETTSKEFQNKLFVDTQERREEEMRLFYVAVTRAKQSVIFVGDDFRQLVLPSSPQYAWKHEIQSAWRVLSPLGANYNNVNSLNLAP